MFASPFFTSGRAAILPTIASPAELHAANSLTQTTQWATLTLGTMLAGWSAAKLGFQWAFVINALSFLFSAAAIANCACREAFRARAGRATPAAVRPWHEYREGLRYMRSVPLIFGIGMISVGWATGGGAAQILFTLFGEQVFHRGAAGIGEIWGFAGVGLLIGGWLGHVIGSRVEFSRLQAHHHHRLRGARRRPTCVQPDAAPTGRRCCSCCSRAWAWRSARC